MQSNVNNVINNVWQTGSSHRKGDGTRRKLEVWQETYFSLESISLSVEELEQKEGQKPSLNVTNRHELLLILEQKVIFIHSGYLPEAEPDRLWCTMDDYSYFLRKEAEISEI